MNKMTNQSIQHFLSFYENYATRKDLEAFKSVSIFLEEVYELAFGDDAINRQYEPMEVLERLKEFSDNALKWEKNHD